MGECNHRANPGILNQMGQPLYGINSEGNTGEKKMIPILPISGYKVSPRRSPAIPLPFPFTPLAPEQNALGFIT